MRSLLVDIVLPNTESTHAVGQLTIRYEMHLLVLHYRYRGI